MSRPSSFATWWPLLIALVYGVSPIDAVPDAVPLLGLVDDLGVGGVALMLAFALWRRRAAVAVAGPEGTELR